MKLMRSVEDITADRAKEQADAVSPRSVRGPDPGPLAVPDGRYTVVYFAGECRWCGTRKRSVDSVTCGHCNFKLKPCIECGGPVGRTSKGEECRECAKGPLEWLRNQRRKDREARNAGNGRTDPDR